MTKLEPYAWQRLDQELLEANGYTGLVAIEAGGGKSLTATLAIKNAKPTVTLILAPQSTHKTAWIPTLADNADVEARIIGNGNKAQRQALNDFTWGYPGVYLTTGQFMARSSTDISDWRGDLIVVDESHTLTTMKSSGQRRLSGYHPSDGQPLSHRFDARMALSGTAMRQNFENLWGTMRFLWPDLDERYEVAHSNPYLWMQDRMDYVDVVTGVEWHEVTWDQYRSRKPDDWGKIISGTPHLGEPTKVKKYVSEKDPGKLLREAPCVIIHKRRETCCSDPDHEGGFLKVEEPQVIEREVALTSKQNKAIRELETIMMTYLNDHPLEVTIPLTQKQRVRQLTLGEASVEYTDDDKSTVVFDENCVSPFTDETIHILSNLPEDENVAIFLESRKFAEVLVKKLNAAKFKAAEYSGVVKADLSKFGTDYRILVGVTSAIGTGTAGLNHISHTEIVFEQPISLTARTQVNARLERLDNTQRVQRYVLLDDYGVQSGRVEALIEKQALVNRSLRNV